MNNCTIYSTTTVWKNLNLKILYELRFNIGSGYRVYYTIEDDIIVLLINGGDKKTQSKDIQRAVTILNKLKGDNNDKY